MPRPRHQFKPGFATRRARSGELSPIRRAGWFGVAVVLASVAAQIWGFPRVHRGGVVLAIIDAVGTLPFLALGVAGLWYGYVRRRVRV